MKPLKTLFNKILFFIGVRLFCWTYRLLAFTWRKKVVFSPEFQKLSDENRGLVIAFWHEHLFASLFITRFHKIITIVSKSSDGRFIAAVLRHFGSQVAQGSSGSGGVGALKHMLDHVSLGSHWGAVAVDGGRKGPRRKLKSGVFEISLKTGAPLFTASLYISAPWVLKKTWDQTVIPLPFSRVHFLIDGPIELLDQDPKSPLNKALLKSQLIKTEKKAEYI